MAWHCKQCPCISRTPAAIPGVQLHSPHVAIESGCHARQRTFQLKASRDFPVDSQEGQQQQQQPWHPQEHVELLRALQQPAQQLRQALADSTRSASQSRTRTKAHGSSSLSRPKRVSTRIQVVAVAALAAPEDTGTDTSTAAAAKRDILAQLQQRAGEQA